MRFRLSSISSSIASTSVRFPEFFPAATFLGSDLDIALGVSSLGIEEVDLDTGAGSVLEYD